MKGPIFYWLLVCLLAFSGAPAAYASGDVVSVKGTSLTLNGKAFMPYGLESMAVIAPPSIRKGKRLAMYDHFMDPKTNFFENARSWKANLIRFDLSQPGLDPSTTLFSTEYLNEIKKAVTLCRQHGFVVIVSINDQSPSGDLVSHKMPILATQRALLSLTELFNDDLGVIYETFSEPVLWPTGDNWKLWQHGGPAPDGGEPVVGTQSLVNAIRKTGAQNLIIVEGLDWGRSFKGMPKIQDPLNRLAYGVHPYYDPNYCSPADWDANFGFLVQQGQAVIATEWSAITGLKGTVKGCCKGQSSEQMTEKARSFLRYLAARRIGLVAWGIDAPGTIVTDISGTVPTTYDGYTWDQPPGWSPPNPPTWAESRGGPGLVIQEYFRRANK